MEDQIAADEALAKALQRQESDAAEAELRSDATNRSRQTRGLAPSDLFQDGWSSWLDTAANTAGDFAMKAANVAAEKATVLASKAEEMRSKIDLDNVFAGSIGVDDVTASGKVVRRINDELDFVYVTENLVAMAYPADISKQGSSTSGNDINKVAAYLKKHHEGKFMIWNISEETYDSSRFADQVLEYRFPGHPAPPLGLLFKICTSIESWLDADEENIGIIHCLTGKGRTATLMACVLTWIGEFSSPVKALEYIADRKGIQLENLTIPSQRRYLTYFSNMLDGVKPRSEPILLRRVIMNTIPVYGNNNGGGDGEGCCPYLQLFKGGKLISTSVPVDENHAKTKAEGSNKALLQWSKASDGCVSFNVDCALQGDILLRARHASNTGQRISMFRAAFHTGYVPTGVLRLSKDWLDGAADSNRFSDDFFIDLIFAPMGVRLPEDGSGSESGPPEAGDKAKDDAGELKASGKGPPPPPGKLGVVEAPSDSGLLIDASSADRYEQTLHSDSRFWEAVGARKNKAKTRKTRKFKSVVRETFTLDDREDGSYDEDDDAVSSVVKPRSATLDRARESKDRDLIEALAQAEAEGEGEGDGDSPSAGLDDSALNVSGAGVEAVGLGLSVPSAARKGADGGSGGVHEGGQEAVSKELAELEELEKQLGLDSAATATANPSAGADGDIEGEGADTGDRELDDLDDLERYLASIQS